MGLAAFAAAVFFVAAIVFEVRKRARLEARGRLLTGEVTKTEEDSSSVYTGMGGFARGSRSTIGS